jgi:ribosomal protein S18 acetylase RimI-like enzyme
VIRPLVADDLPAVKKVIDATGLFPSDMLDEMAGPYLDAPGADEFWLTSVETDVVGVAYCAPERMAEGTWNLYLVAVRPDAQRGGQGAALVRAVEQRVAGEGGRVLLIETSGLGTFAGQRAFYDSLGYREEARIRDFYRAGEDKVVFWKSLKH